MSESSKLVVMTSGDRDINDVKKELIDNGFEVEEVLDELGFITGEVSDISTVERLRSVSGVSDVSEAPPPVDIGPPGETDTL